MAGITIVTDLDPKAALKTVKSVAKGLGFAVYRVDDWELQVQKGNLVASIFLGAFIAYCNFQVFVEETRSRVKIVIERNTPWWTGFIGIGRVKTMAKNLADLVEDDIEDQGGKVYTRKEHRSLVMVFRALADA